MRILLIHQNFPGQFRRIAQVWAQQAGWEVLGLGRNTAPGMDGIRWIPYQLHRQGLKEQHPYLRQMETAVLHGQAVARALMGAPELIVCDEPTSALDTDRRERFLELLFASVQRVGSTLVFVSHDLSLAERFGRTVALGQLNRSSSVDAA